MTDTDRAYRIYLYAACLISVLLLLFASASALYAVVRIAVPATTAKATSSISLIGGSSGSAREDDERDRGLAQLIQSGILALVAGGVFAFHWTRAEALDRPTEPTAVVQPPTSAARAPRRRRTAPADEDDTAT